MRYRWINDLPLIEVMRDGDWRAPMPVKRLFDLGGAAALAIAASPLFVLAALAVRLSSAGPRALSPGARRAAPCVRSRWSSSAP